MRAAAVFTPSGSPCQIVPGANAGHVFIPRGPAYNRNRTPSIRRPCFKMRVAFASTCSNSRWARHGRGSPEAIPQ